MEERDPQILADLRPFFLASAYSDISPSFLCSCFPDSFIRIPHFTLGK